MDQAQVILSYVDKVLFIVEKHLFNRLLHQWLSPLCKLFWCIVESSSNIWGSWLSFNGSDLFFLMTTKLQNSKCVRFFLIFFLVVSISSYKKYTSKFLMPIKIVKRTWYINNLVGPINVQEDIRPANKANIDTIN